ncbi:hypothetical protein BDZ91DRAFT_722814 [Kalaharituber pfeilii]|nr:hypothetical protein BDZ91DRAFT_722814 [Kalaharituber pfeilii]
MVSPYQVQCLNCGTIDDVIAMDRHGESSWCSQCGFTRSTETPMQERRRLAIEEDEQLAQLLSRNMFLTDRRPQQQAIPTSQAPPVPHLQQTPAPAAPVATPGVNISISQHYHHYRPVAPPAPTSPPTSPSPQSSSSPTYIQHLIETSSNPETALQDYHRSLVLMEEQYHNCVHQQQQQYPPSPTGSSVSSVQDDHHLQLILLEQHNIAQEAEKLRLMEEEKMLYNQLMTDSRHRSQVDDVMVEDAEWVGGQPMPNLVHHQKQPSEPLGKVVFPGQPWVASGDSQDEMYGMEDDESPCVIYYSRGYNTGAHFF